MVTRFLKSLIPNSVKHHIAMRLPGNKQYKAKVEQSAIKEQIDEELISFLVDFIPKVQATTNVESFIVGQADTNNTQPNPLFKDFLEQYKNLRDTNSSELERVKREYPVSANLAEQVFDYFQYCDSVSGKIAQVMKHNTYTVMPFYTSPKAIELYGYKDTLPKIGLISHPHHDPRDFIVDALNGIAAAEDVDPEMIIANTWAKRSYDYLRLLKEEVSKKLTALPHSFFERFPSKDWFIEQMTYRAQCEIGLQQLLKQSRWKAIVVGDATSPLCLALMSTPREKRSPVILFNHGMPYGNPIAAMFLKADYVFVRGRRDANFMIDLGIPAPNIIKVGSTSHEGFPADKALAQQRQAARLRCGIADETPILVFAVTWDPYLYKSRTASEIHDLVIESFKCLAGKLNGQKPILYIKYHPHPGNDPTFSTSRLQYPFHKFLSLVDAGYTIRLAKNFDDCLPAADCFIGHESTVLCDALAVGVPTVSLDYGPPNGRPTLDYDSYTAPSAHKLLCVFDNADTISDAILSLMEKPRTEVWTHCRLDWSNVFDCGRSEGIARITNFIRTI